MEIKLPLMTISTDLDTALADLRKARRSALLSEEGGRYHLFTAGTIVVGRSLGIKTLADLKDDPRSAAPQIVGSLLKEMTDAQRTRSREESPQGSPPTTQATYDIVVRSGNYTVNRIVGDEVFVGLLDSELATKYLASPTDCYCDGPRHHDTFSVDVRDGDPCPFRDGHKIVCAR